MYRNAKKCKWGQGNAHCSAMRYNDIKCITMQYQCELQAMQCNAMQCNTMQCNAMQCNAMQCNAMNCYAI